MARVEDMLQKMMRRFDASDEKIKELGSDLASIGQKLMQMQSRSSILNYKWPNCIRRGTHAN